MGAGAGIAVAVVLVGGLAMTEATLLGHDVPAPTTRYDPPALRERAI